jgi:hypothetical protein
VFYSFDVVVPRATPADSPVIVEAALVPGVVTRVDVLFPSGCSGLVSTVADRFTSQIWPTNADGTIRGDDDTVSWGENYPLDGDPLLFKLKGWAPASRFEHTITWRFAHITLEEAAARSAAPGLIQRIAEAVLGR